MRVCIFVSLYTKTYQTIGFAGKYPLPAVPRVEALISVRFPLKLRGEKAVNCLSNIRFHRTVVSSSC